MPGASSATSPTPPTNFAPSPPSSLLPCLTPATRKNDELAGVAQPQSVDAAPWLARPSDRNRTQYVLPDSGPSGYTPSFCDRMRNGAKFLPTAEFLNECANRAERNSPVIAVAPPIHACEATQALPQGVPWGDRNGVHGAVMRLPTGIWLQIHARPEQNGVELTLKLSPVLAREIGTLLSAEPSLGSCRDWAAEVGLSGMVLCLEHGFVLTSWIAAGVCHQTASIAMSYATAAVLGRLLIQQADACEMQYGGGDVA
jgi:hypothetical protein